MNDYAWAMLARSPGHRFAMACAVSIGLVGGSLGTLTLAQPEPATSPTEQEVLEPGNAPSQADASTQAPADSHQVGETPTGEAGKNPPGPSPAASPTKEVPPPVATPGIAEIDPPGTAERSEQAGEAATPTASPPTPQRTPGQLLRSLLTTSPETRLPGMERSLTEVLRFASPGPHWRHEQTARIRAYWDLSAAMTDDILAQRERMELKSLHAGIATPGAAWKQALADAQKRIHLARRAARVAQYRLHQRLDPQPRTAIRGEMLPIPADHPHCGVYDTRYDEIFQDRPSEFAWQLHELLGSQYQQLRSQTAAEEEALARLQQVSQLRAVRSDGSELLRAYNSLLLRRRAFVVAVHAYNRAIANYTQLVLPGNIDADRLVAMLIYVKPDKQTIQWQRPDIEGTGGYQQFPTQSQQEHPSTYADKPLVRDAPIGGHERLESDSPAQPSQPGEHSIVVPDRGR